MTAHIIYGTDFRARREREAAEMEVVLPTFAAVEDFPFVNQQAYRNCLARNDTEYPAPKDSA